MSEPISADLQQTAGLPGGGTVAPPSGGTAEEVSAWWRSLPEADRNQLIAAHPPELGNLNGIPAAARDKINTAVLADDLHRVEDAANHNGVTVDEVLKSPGQYGLSADDVVRYRNAGQTQRGLDHDRGSDPGNSRPVLLWAYDPLAFNGQGRAALAIGDPDLASDIAVVVPGASSSVANGWLYGGHNDAINLYDQARAAYPGIDGSVIAWMGYDAPDGYSDPRVAEPWLARSGGAQLAQDVNGLWQTHSDQNPPHVSVIGHSYGSTTVADAFAGSGMRANDAILLGSPGTDLAKHAADFHVDGGQVYVGSASTDPVSWIGESGTVPDVLNDVLGEPFGSTAGLGPDPAGDGFGSVRFHAEPTGRATLDFRDHSHYYDLGGEALRSMILIITGHGSELAQQGLLAQGRRQPHISTPSAITLPGLGRIGLPHIDTRIPGIPASIDPEADRPESSITDDHRF